MNYVFIIALIFGMTVSFYLLGFTAPAFQLNTYGALDANTIFNNIISYLFSLNGAITSAAIAGLFALTMISGQNMWTVFIMAIMFVVLQLLVFPTMPIATLPSFIAVAINAFFTLTTVVAMIAFLRG